MNRPSPLYSPLLAMALLTVALPVQAQDQRGALELGMAVYPAHASIRDSESAFAQEDYQIRLLFPVKLRETVYLLPQFDYKLTDLHIQRGGPEYTLSKLHALSVSATSFAKVSTRWSIVTQFGVGFASDLEGPVTLNAATLNITAFGIYQFTDSVKVGTGVRYDRMSGKLLPLPLLFLDWMPTPRWRLGGAIPSRIELGYLAQPRVALGVEGRLEGDRYDLAGRPAGRQAVELSTLTVQLAPWVTWHSPSMVNVRFRSGLAFLRRMSIFVNDERQRRLTAEPAYFFSAEMWLGPSGWEDP